MSMNARGGGPVLALTWMAGALAAFSAVAVTGRGAAAYVNTHQLMMWRGFFSAALILLAALAMGRLAGLLRTAVPHLHLARNTVHFGAQFAWFYALTVIPLAELFALEFTAPLWVALLAPLFLSERLDGWRLAAVVLGFVGALVVVLMPAIAKGAAIALGGGALWALAAAIGFAGVQIATKRITRTDDAFAILAFMAAIQFCFALVIAAWDPVVPDGRGLAWLLALSAISLIAHFCVARAFAHADAIIVAPMDFLRLPLIAAIGVLLYGEALDGWVLTGGLLVIAANLVNIWSERRRRPPSGVQR